MPKHFAKLSRNEVNKKEKVKHNLCSKQSYGIKEIGQKLSLCHV